MTDTQPLEPTSPNASDQSFKQLRLEEFLESLLAISENLASTQTTILKKCGDILALLEDDDSQEESEDSDADAPLDVDDISDAAQRTALVAGSSDDDMDFEDKYAAALQGARKKLRAVPFASRASLATSSRSIPRG